MIENEVVELNSSDSELEEPKQEPKDVKTSMIDEVQQPTLTINQKNNSKFSIHKKITELKNLCYLLENTDEIRNLVTRLLLPYFYKADASYTGSASFYNLIQSAIDKMRRTQKVSFISMRKIIINLKAHVKAMVTGFISLDEEPDKDNIKKTKSDKHGTEAIMDNSKGSDINNDVIELDDDDDLGEKKRKLKNKKRSKESRVRTKVKGHKQSGLDLNLYDKDNIKKTNTIKNGTEATINLESSKGLDINNDIIELNDDDLDDKKRKHKKRSKVSKTKAKRPKKSGLDLNLYGNNFEITEYQIEINDIPKEDKIELSTESPSQNKFEMPDSIEFNDNDAEENVYSYQEENSPDIRKRLLDLENEIVNCKYDIVRTTKTNFSVSRFNTNYRLKAKLHELQKQLCDLINRNPKSCYVSQELMEGLAQTEFNSSEYCVNNANIEDNTPGSSFNDLTEYNRFLEKYKNNYSNYIGESNKNNAPNSYVTIQNNVVTEHDKAVTEITEDVTEQIENVTEITEDVTEQNEDVTEQTKVDTKPIYIEIEPQVVDTKPEMIIKSSEVKNNVAFITLDSNSHKKANVIDNSDATTNEIAKEVTSELTEEFQPPIDSVKEARIRHIENDIEAIKEQILRLDNSEVDLDSYNSEYIQSDRLKLHLLNLHKTLCSLTNSEPECSSSQVRISVPEGKPSGPARRLEMWLNDCNESDSVPFPDFLDVVKCVATANIEDTLGWDSKQVLFESRSLFMQCGQQLQRRRQNKEWSHLQELMEGMGEDPADLDPDLQVQLARNKARAEEREQEIIQKFCDVEKELKQSNLKTQKGNSLGVGNELLTKNSPPNVTNADEMYTDESDSDVEIVEENFFEFDKVNNDLVLKEVKKESAENSEVPNVPIADSCDDILDCLRQMENNGDENKTRLIHDQLSVTIIFDNSDEEKSELSNDES